MESNIRDKEFKIIMLVSAWSEKWKNDLKSYKVEEDWQYNGKKNNSYIVKSENNQPQLSRYQDEKQHHC